MGDLFILGTHLLATVARLMRPRGVPCCCRRVSAAQTSSVDPEPLPQRAPHLTPWDQRLLGFGSLFRPPQAHSKNCGRLRPSTFLRFHRLSRELKYHQLYASGCRRRPGPKGSSRELIAAIVEMKYRNTRFGCPGIARSFGVEIDSACSLSTTDSHPGMMARHGSPTLDMRRTVCRAST